ncbi:MAG: glycosyltransferase family 39 protein [Gammaproteobacteria bacterium]|jgi:4-amino-4-deoxy-L-arabinose transferase-like glycosyltransferase
MQLTRTPALVVLALIVAVIWFVNANQRDLFKTDEGRYAEIPREMLATGDWVTPHLDGFKYLEKPPLHYWATATAYALFGQHNWTARLWTNLTGLLSILLAGWAGWRLFGREAGVAGALMLTGAPYFSMLGHVNTLDMGLTFFMSLNLFGFMLAQRDGATEREQRGWMYASWAGAALAVLTKGLVGIVLPGLVLAVYVVLRRDWRLIRRMHWPGGLVIFGALTLPWFILAAMRNPQFLWFFFIHEHLERYLTTIHDRMEPWWYFLPILLAGFVAWWPQAWASWRAVRIRPAAQPGTLAPRLLLWLWVGLIVVFFSFSDSKLPDYILPVFPALAVLAGEGLMRAGARSMRWSAAISAVAGAGLLAAVPKLATYHKAGIPPDYYQTLAYWAAGAFAVVLVAGVLAWFLARRRMLLAAAVLAGGWLLFGQLILTGSQVMSPAFSGRSLADQIRPHLTPSMPLFTVRHYQQSLPFYLGRTLTPVEYENELAFGMKQAPELRVASLDDFVRRWRSLPRAVAVMEPDTYHQLRARGLPMEVIGRDVERLAVRKP